MRHLAPHIRAFIAGIPTAFLITAACAQARSSASPRVASAPPPATSSAPEGSADDGATPDEAAPADAAGTADAAPADAASATATATFTATADAQIASDAPLLNAGTATRMATDGSPQTYALMRFDVSGLAGTVSSAKVRVYVNNPSDAGPSLFRTAGAWTESAVTWSNRPTLEGGSFGTAASAPTATWIEFDVTSAVTADGTYDFALVSLSTDGSTYHTREGEFPPQLVITTGTTAPGTPLAVDVTLQPASGVSGTQRVNFAVPLQRGQLTDPARVRVLAGSTELAAGRRALARYADGSIRSVQIQVQTAATAGAVLQVRFNETPTKQPIALVDVASTLVAADGTRGPKVWARLPATWLSGSGVAGPLRAQSQTTGTLATAWNKVCDYQNHAVDAFLASQSSKDAWLYDRGTAMYRGYARRGDLVTLESAYRETAIYRARMTGTGTSTRIGVPGSASDLKYHYNQNMAIHYLLTGDDRFRESAENLAIRVSGLWNPDYNGGGQFWTERHAGFGLLAYVWASIVSDDRAAQMRELADDAVDAYLEVQRKFPPNYSDQNARCFAHQGSAHGEPYSGWGCSPWMTAILVDALDAYATERGGADATAARTAIVRAGRIFAREGRDSTGRPLYWMGVGPGNDERDPYEEHWGELAYLIAMAWHHGGRSEGTLRSAADSLIAGLVARGTSPHLRSFNWQCRSAIAAPFFLQ